MYPKVYYVYKYYFCIRGSEGGSAARRGILGAALFEPEARSTESCGSKDGVL
jgi:hypothetical protein